MNAANGSDARLTVILERLLDPVEDLLATLETDGAAAETESPPETTKRLGAERGETVSATIAIPTSLAKRGGQTFVRFSALNICGECKGRGTAHDRNPCRRCGGEGRIAVDRRLNVTFPAGVTAGDELRVSGEGNEAPDGGPPGDLVLYVMLAPSRRLTRVIPWRSE
jgi:molecular chaperone DnaJ